MIDAAKEKRHRTELRFHLETPEGSAPQDFPKEINVKTVKMLGWCTPIFEWFLFCLGISRETIALLPNHKSKCAHHASHLRNQGHSGNLFQKAHGYPETWTIWTYPVRAQCIFLLMQILFHLQWLSEFTLHQMLTDLILAMDKTFGFLVLLWLL